MTGEDRGVQPGCPAWLVISVLAFSVVPAGCGKSDTEASLPFCAVPLGDSPVRGPAHAWVTAVEFADFECPYCGAAETTIGQVDQECPGVVRWVYMYLPLPEHTRAVPAATAAECAHEQGLFWPMHDLLFAHQDALSDSDLAWYATQVGVDMALWRACVSSEPPMVRIEADILAARRAQVPGTPSFFFNGNGLLGARPLADFLAAVDRAERSAQQSAGDAGDYYASLEGTGCQ
jgi:protein-disulfide isomerase